MPPEEAVSALKKSCTAERKGGGTDRAVPRLANDGILNPF